MHRRHMLALKNPVVFLAGFTFTALEVQTKEQSEMHHFLKNDFCIWHFRKKAVNPSCLESNKKMSKAN